MNLETLVFTDESNGSVDGKKFQFIEQEEPVECDTNCIFKHLSQKECDQIKCNDFDRTDNKNGIFKYID